VEVGSEGGLDVDPPVVLSYCLRQIERQAEAKNVPGIASDFDEGLNASERVGPNGSDAGPELRRNVDREEQE
jgi:hypothetical protein